MTRKSRRELWADLAQLKADSVEWADLNVASKVVTITEENPDPEIEVSDDAELLKTKSPVVTVWAEPRD